MSEVVDWKILANWDSFDFGVWELYGGVVQMEEPVEWLHEHLGKRIGHEKENEADVVSCIGSLEEC